MYLAIAKKYLENHNEEDFEEFNKGITSEMLEQSHSPNLNQFYNQKGLNSSYNRGQFLHLLTDYLFYNRFLNKISITTISDFDKANKKIIERYGLEIPGDLIDKIVLEDGELEEIDFESICKFIETVSQLDLEKYAEQTREADGAKKLTLEGRKEGLLYKYKGEAFLCDNTEVYLYGFENNYGLLIERTLGGPKETKGAKEGLYKATPIGLALRPSEIWREANVTKLRESLSDEEKLEIKSICQSEFTNELDDRVAFKFENVNKEQVKKLLNIMRRLPNRTPKKEIEDELINLSSVDVEDVFIQ